MIKEAVYIKDYQLKVIFLNNATKIIDLYSFISKSKHPLIKKYLNKNLFQQFHIEYGTICWGDNDFDINPNKILGGFYEKTN